MGAPDAVVTIVEWADFEGPFCRQFYPVLDELVRSGLAFHDLEVHGACLEDAFVALTERGHRELAS